MYDGYPSDVLVWHILRVIALLFLTSLIAGVPCTQSNCISIHGRLNNAFIDLHSPMAFVLGVRCPMRRYVRLTLFLNLLRSFFLSLSPSIPLLLTTVYDEQD